MRGVVKFKDGQDGWEIRDIPRPDPMDHEVEIKIKAAGICGSEVHLYHDNHFYTPPVVVGHEFAGEISRVGKNVTNWKVGDRVVTENHKSACMACAYCKSGALIFCKERKAVGYVLNGGWTSYFCTPARLLIPIPDSVSFEVATMTEPVAVATMALIEKQTIGQGDVVLVQGCGTIGLVHAIVAQSIGAGTVIITGTEADEAVRLPIARKFGFDHVININKTNLKEFVMDLTDGKGVDVFVDCSGSPEGLYSTIELTRRAGKIVAIGEPPKPDIEFPWLAAIFRACTIYFSLGSSYAGWKHALRIMEKVNLSPLITHVMPIDDYRKGFQLLDDKEALKVILLPD